jgi:hypothetical protein
MNVSETDRLIAVMKDETELFSRYAIEQEGVARHIRERQWTELENTLATMEAIALRMREIEAERAALFARLLLEKGLKRGTNFYRYAYLHPEGKRRELNSVYREMKLKAIRTRIESKALGDYLDNARATLGGVMETLFPRKGQAYTRYGRKPESELSAMVLNATI